jgi:type I restriction enzyme S subunit
MKSLLAHFELSARAPGGIEALRKYILELAVHGKLVPQDKDDEPASELLKRITADKARLVKEGKIKAQKELPPIGEEQKPFTLPAGWEWVRFGEVSNKITDGTHATPHYQTSGIPFVSAKDIGNSRLIFTNCKYISKEEHQELYKRCNPEYGDLLISKSGSIGTVVVNTVKFEFSLFESLALVKRTREMNTEYFKLAAQSLCSNLKQDDIRGVAVKHLHLNVLETRLFPLAPLPEQARIVARVEELMAVLDRLDAKTAEAESLRTRSLCACATALSGATGSAERKAAWSRMASSFDSLVQKPEDVKAFRSSILELAVRGALVPQDKHDEPASELLKRIATEKAQLVKEGKIKAGKELPPISEEEKPFELPAEWEWVRLGEISLKLSSGSTPLGGRQVYQSNGPLFLRSQNVWNSGLELSGGAHISADTHRKMGNTHVFPHDLLFNITGASIGRCALVPDEFPEANVSQHVVIIRPVLRQYRFFLHMVLISDHIQNMVQNVQVGVSREGLSVAKLQNFVIPLPPLPEQARIVARVEELMATCDRLEAALSSMEQEAKKFAQSVMHH